MIKEIIQFDMTDAITDWNKAYDNVGSIENAHGFIENWPVLAQRFRETANAELNISYGVEERNKLDVFFPENVPKGLFIFVHGGYWLRFEKSFWSHLATGPLAKSWVVAMPSYTLCPNARISQITREITAAIETAATKVGGPIILCGHSAGGHLVTRQICEDTKLGPDVLERIERVISISGVHDLRPLMNIEFNKIIGLGQREAMQESPALHKPLKEIPVECIVGGGELAEFIRQNDLLANIWCGLGVATNSYHIADKHHFDVVDDLENPDGLIAGFL